MLLYSFTSPARKDSIYNIRHFCIFFLLSIYIYINKNVNVRLYLSLISESSSPIALKFLHNVAFNYARVLYTYFMRMSLLWQVKTSLCFSHLLAVKVTRIPFQWCYRFQNSNVILFQLFRVTLHWNWAVSFTIADNRIRKNILYRQVLWN